MKTTAMLASVTFCLLAVLVQDLKGQEPSNKAASDGKLAMLELKTPPRPLQIVRPEFPKGHWKKEPAPVELEATITVSGDVKDARVVSGDKTLADVALTSVQQWKYAPAQLNGMPVEIQHHFVFLFSTEDHTVHMGPDELSLKLPLGPSKEMLADVAAGKVFRVGAEVTPPQCKNMLDPQYSELARRLKYQGTSTLAAIVGPDGHVRDTWVVIPAGEKLDEQALTAVKNSKFKPGMLDGVPVSVLISVQMSFNLY